MTLKIFYTLIDNVERQVLSFVPHETAFETGIPNSAIVGYLKNPEFGLIPENIQYNPEFIKLFHKVVKDTAAVSKHLIEASHKQNVGYVYITDMRDKNYPNTKAQDIIGAFELLEGSIIEDKYQPNPNYQLISTDGVFLLPDSYMLNLKKVMFS
jgi:hypothetical protein